MYLGDRARVCRVRIYVCKVSWWGYFFIDTSGKKRNSAALAAKFNQELLPMVTRIKKYTLSFIFPRT